MLRQGSLELGWSRRPLSAALAALVLAGCAAPESEETAQAAAALEAALEWSDTASMSVARRGLTATPLGDGRVLVAGGQRLGAVDVGSVFWETAELFEPQLGQFFPVAAAMTQKRYAHAAAPLPGGKVLIIGGGLSPMTAEIFDPVNGGKWTATGDLAHPRADAAAVALGDGRVLVCGGENAAQGTAEIFDPVNGGSWSPAGTMNAPRCWHSATLLKDGRVLVAGGHRCDDASKVLKTAEIFTPSSGLWTVAAPMKVARTFHAAARLENGRVMVAGGSNSLALEALGETSSVETYLPAQNIWTELPFLATPRALHTVTALENGAVLVTGGADDTASVLRSAELYDPDAERWIAAGLMSHGRLSHAAATLPGGAVLASGGQHQSSAEVYRPFANGQTCELGRQCASGFCVDGVCCNDVCTGQCVTCALAGAEGTCSKAAAGTDPHRNCGQGGPCDDVCDESGVCTDRVGKECVAAACSEDGAKVSAPASCQVRGGECLVAAPIDCAPYRCGESGAPKVAGCLASCKSIDDCAAGYACDPEGHCRTRPDVAFLPSDGCAAAPQPSPRSAAAWALCIALAAALRRARRRSP